MICLIGACLCLLVVLFGLLLVLGFWFARFGLVLFLLVCCCFGVCLIVGALRLCCLGCLCGAWLLFAIFVALVRCGFSCGGARVGLVLFAWCARWVLCFDCGFPMGWCVCWFKVVDFMW